MIENKCERKGIHPTRGPICTFFNTFLRSAFLFFHSVLSAPPVILLVAVFMTFLIVMDHTREAKEWNGSTELLLLLGGFSSCSCAQCYIVCCLWAGHCCFYIRLRLQKHHTTTAAQAHVHCMNMEHRVSVSVDECRKTSALWLSTFTWKIIVKNKNKWCVCGIFFFFSTFRPFCRHQSPVGCPLERGQRKRKEMKHRKTMTV